MNVLITGAGGFIGSHLVDSQLAQGHSVRAADLHTERLAHALGNPDLELIPGDICNREFIQKIVTGVDIVYHLASAHLDVSLPDKNYRLANVGATQSLLEAACNAGVKRFVHCSSVGVIGDVENPPADETSPCHPTNIYERTKLEGERAAVEFARQTGFPVVVARPAWVYGPRCPRTEKLLRMIAKGRFIIFGSGHNYRHPVYISDAVQGLERCALAEGANAEVYILAGDEPVHVVDLVNLIRQELDVRSSPIHLPIILGRLGGFGLETAYKPFRRQPPFSRRSLDFFLKHNAYRIGKARHELGYQPQVDLRSGIQHTIRWLHSQTKNFQD